MILNEKIRSRKAIISVLGLGYMGLPMASILANNGFRVYGVDVNEKRVKDIQERICPFNEKGLKKEMEKAINSGNLIPATKIRESDIFIICVPTPEKDHKAELKYVVSALKMIKTVIKDNNLIILESTVPPNTCKDLIKPMIKGTKFYLVHCPERAIPGNTLYEIKNNDRIIGGIDKESGEIARELYSTFVCGKIFVTDSSTAETCKLMENTFRDVNIALANEFAKICEEIGINVWEAIELANKHPRVNILRPGPGVGGHCIPIDPWFLIEKSKTSKLIPIAREINNSMPDYIVEKVIEKTEHIKNPKISILGVAYKKNVDDTRESPAIEIIKKLKNKGFDVHIHDPYVKDFEFEKESLEKVLDKTDCILLLTDHDYYKEIDFGNYNIRNKIIIDSRNFFRNKKI